MIARLKEFSSTQLGLLAFFVSLAAIESAVAGADILLKGEVGYGELLAGFAASFPIAILVGNGLNAILARQRAPELPAAEPEGEAAGTAAEVAASFAPSAPTPASMDVAPVAERTRKQTEIRQAIRNLDVLPAMPVIAQRLLVLRLDTEEGEQELLRLVGQDAQISAKLIGLANSVALGASRQIGTVREAALLLGSRRVQSIATGIAIISLMAKAPVGEFNIHDLWLHSIRVAFAMQGIARAMPAEMRPTEDRVLLAGMLHDIGYLVLAYIDPPLSDKLHNRLAAEPERPVLEVEREIVDVCHDELGAELATHWNLPPEIVAVLRYHHDPDAPAAATAQPLVRMINVAEKLQQSLGLVEFVAPGVSAGEWELLGIAPDRADEVREAVDQQVGQAMQLADSFQPAKLS